MSYALLTTCLGEPSGSPFSMSRCILVQRLFGRQRAWARLPLHHRISLQAGPRVHQASQVQAWVSQRPEAPEVNGVHQIAPHGTW